MYMGTKKTGAGACFSKRIEELIQKSTLSPETVLHFMRTAQANPENDPLKEIERLQRKQRHTE